MANTCTLDPKTTSRNCLLRMRSCASVHTTTRMVLRYTCHTHSHSQCASSSLAYTLSLHFVTNFLSFSISQSLSVSFSLFLFLSQPLSFSPRRLDSWQMAFDASKLNALYPPTPFPLRPSPPFHSFSLFLLSQCPILIILQQPIHYAQQIGSQWS